MYKVEVGGGRRCGGTYNAVEACVGVEVESPLTVDRLWRQRACWNQCNVGFQSICVSGGCALWIVCKRHISARSVAEVPTKRKRK
jgi:hypothetical protein